MKTGDEVQIRINGDAEWRAGTLAIVSRNQKSIAVQLDGAVLPGFIDVTASCGMLLLAADEIGTYRDIVSNLIVEIRPREA